MFFPTYSCYCLMQIKTWKFGECLNLVCSLFWCSFWSLKMFRPHYNLYLRSIAVNGQLLPVDPAVFATSNNRGTIVDSGTTLAYLVEEAYDPFVMAVSVFSFVCSSKVLFFLDVSKKIGTTSSREHDMLFPAKNTKMNFRRKSSYFNSDIIQSPFVYFGSMEKVKQRKLKDLFLPWYFNQ